MFPYFRKSAIILGLMTLLTGVLYPCLVTGVAQLVFPYQSNGSILESGGRALGSELIGQPFSEPGYFWGRLSATSRFPYNAASSGGSNFGPLHPGLEMAAAARIKALRTGDPRTTAIPVDLVTASGSGLDPHISPAAAEAQVRRVAAARSMTENEVSNLVGQYVEPRQFGVLGERRVNVLRLNLALDAVCREGTPPSQR